MMEVVENVFTLTVRVLIQTAEFLFVGYDATERSTKIKGDESGAPTVAYRSHKWMSAGQ